MILLQPHEGVTGADLSGDPLMSLDESALPMRKTILFLTYNLYRSLINPRGLYTVMQNPIPGELVVVTDHLSTLEYRPELVSDDTICKSLGYLVEHRLEWWDTDEKWQQMIDEGAVEPDDERSKDRPYYIQYGPDPKDICRWVNCQVLRVPTGLVDKV